MKRSGVYVIRNIVTGERYVGSSVNVDHRWVNHRKELNAGVHHSPKLQEAWRKYGSSCFEFRIVMLCSPSELLRNEQSYLDREPTAYNISPTAGSSKGVVRTDYTKSRMSAAKRNMSAATKAKMRASRLAYLARTRNTENS